MSTETAAPARRFVARQPILDTRMHVEAYELLFRSGPINRYQGEDSHQASCEVIVGGTLLQDLQVLTSGKTAWINVDRKTLLGGYCRLLPQDGVVVELLETVEPDDAVIEACRELREQGYSIALDDFIDRPGLEPLLEIASYVKVDFMAGDAAEHEEFARRFRDTHLTLLAEKVETQDEVRAAKAWGYELFQGFFFAKPTMISGGDIPANQASLLGMLNEIHKPELDYDRLEQVIRQDVALCYRLLRYINAACRGLRYEVSSIRQGVILLGIQEVVRWATLSVMTMTAKNRTPELMTTALVRAKFCESLGGPFGLTDRADDLFLLGLFSVVDALLERPIEEVVDPLPIAPDTKAALRGESNALRRVYDFCVSYEQGGWGEWSGTDVVVSEAEIAESYLEAVRWSATIEAG